MGYGLTFLAGVAVGVIGLILFCLLQVAGE